MQASFEQPGQPQRILLALLSVLLLLLSFTGSASGQCMAGPLPRDVNESSPVGAVIQALDSSYNLVAGANIDPAYACYFELLNSSLRLRRQFNMENFTSCVNGMTIVPVTPQTIRLSCSDGVTTATFLVRLVDINEFPPVFEPSVFRVNVSEATAVGATIIQMNGFVKDYDFSNVRTFNILIVNGSNNDFAMNSGITSGIVTIQRTLDFDAGIRQYIMNVSAADISYDSTSLPVPLTGYATLIVDILDTDDMSPVFTQSTYSLHFPENDTSYLNRSLETSPQLLARDGDVGINQTINYAIASAAWSNAPGGTLNNITFLSINASTGLFNVLSLIDREALPSSALLVQVRAYQLDNPTTRVAMSLVLVTVGDINDNPPVMSSISYTASIAENSLVGSYVTVVKATDADLGENATFIFLLNDTSGAFRIDANSGTVTVANSSLLDSEARASFTMSVWARESLTSQRFSSEISQLTVYLIDVNDNAPVFNATAYAFAVSTTAPIGTVVGAVVAQDADADVASGNGRVARYYIAWAGAGVASLIQLDAATGFITTRASLADVTATSLVLQVAAEDAALPVSARLHSSTVVEITVSPAAASTTTASASTSLTSMDSSTAQSSAPTMAPTAAGAPTSSSGIATSAASTSATTAAATVGATTAGSFPDSVWNSSTGVTAVWLVNGSFALVELQTTVTTASGNVSTTAQTTLLPVNVTVASTPSPPAVASNAGMPGAQVALIIICVLLLLLAIGLTALLIWLWRKHQMRLKGLIPIDSNYPLATATGRNGAVVNGANHAQQQQQEAATTPQENGASAVAAAANAEAASTIISPIKTGQITASQSSIAMTNIPPSGAISTEPAVPKRHSVATLFLGIHSLQLSPLTFNESLSPHQAESISGQSPNLEDFPDFDDWQNPPDQSADDHLTSSFNNYWCLPATVTVSTAL